MQTILIADDDPNLRLLVALTLDTPDFEVIEAANGHEVLAILERRQVDLIVLDWMMPGMSGIEVARELCLQEDGFEVPIVMLTAKTEPADLIKAQQVGVRHYLIKPFSPIELFEMIERALTAPARAGAGNSLTASR